jgi:ribonucleoside-diphosphate reductase beta chain
MVWRRGPIGSSDESCHLEFAFEVVDVVRTEHPELFDARLESDIVEMMRDAVDCELQFAEDLLSGGVAGLSVREMRQYLEYVADSRVGRLGMKPIFGSKNPFGFMELQDVQELANFFERRVSAYQVAVAGEVAFHEDF